VVPTVREQEQGSPCTQVALLGLDPAGDRLDVVEMGFKRS
jgi:hypothetical protein